MATTKQDLVDLICTKQEGMTKKAATELLDAVFDKITEAIKADQKFTFPGFGTFEIRTRRARRCTLRHPRCCRRRCAVSARVL